MSTPDYQAALDAAWRAVDALGGTFDENDLGEVRYADALEDACRAIKKLGARDPDVVRADLLEALKAILSEDTVSVHVGYDNAGNYVYAEAVRTDSDAFIKARAALPKATGAP